MRHILAILVFAGCTADLTDTNQASNIHGDGPVVAGVPGAIFTTLRDGSSVNANIYAAKADVYLDGGPASAHGPVLPEGDYRFQVTNPSGAVVLSSDPVSCRAFHIDVGGRITAVLGGSCAHAWGNDLVRPGNLTVQLMPYDDTPNHGGEYKVWVTPADAFEANDGFAERDSKTDNFKVLAGAGSGSCGG